MLGLVTGGLAVLGGPTGDTGLAVVTITGLLVVVDVVVDVVVVGL